MVQQNIFFMFRPKKGGGKGQYYEKTTLFQIIYLKCSKSMKETDLINTVVEILVNTPST